MSWENLLFAYAKPKAQISCEKTAQLISANVLCDLDSTIPLLLKSKISSLKPSSLTVQPSLCLTWSETPKICFLATRLKMCHIVRKPVLHMSLVMRKPAFCICENKDADQLRSNREADQRLCFRYKDSTIPLLSKSEISSF